MEHYVVRQRGFLLIVTVAILVIISFIGLVIVNIFSNQVNSSTNMDQSHDAYHLAFSGMEIAKRDVTTNALSCINLASSHTNESLLQGEFSVTSDRNNVSSTLQTALTTATSTITLTNASMFASAGVVKIDNEYIFYGSRSGNVLGQVSRGKANTSIVAHAANAAVTQNQCLITVNAGSPNLTLASASKATIKSVILYSTFSVGGYQPSITSGGNTTLSGNGRVYNDSVTLNGSGYAGSTIVSLGSVSISGSGDTAVNNASGDPVVSSNRDNLENDVVSNLSLSTTVFESYFGTMTEAQLVTMAQSGGQYYATFNSETMNNTTNKVIYVAGGVSLSSNTTLTLGTPTAPVVLYINGDLDVTGNATLNVSGIIYVEGNVSFTGNATLEGSGSLAAGGNLSVGGSGIVELSPNDVVNLQLTPGSAITNLYNNLIPNAANSFLTTGFGVQPTVVQ